MPAGQRHVGRWLKCATGRLRGAVTLEVLHDSCEVGLPSSIQQKDTTLRNRIADDTQRWRTEASLCGS